MASYSISVNDKSPIIIGEGKLDAQDIIRINEDEYHGVLSNKSYHAHILSVDMASKVVQVQINNQIFSCVIKDDLDLTIASLDLNSTNKNQNKNLISTMPGLVLSVIVKEGDHIKAGDELMILEAMKMENVLKAGNDGVITKICCEEKSAVDKGQLLIEIE